MTHHAMDRACLTILVGNEGNAVPRLSASAAGLAGREKCHETENAPPFGQSRRITLPVVTQ